MKGDVQRPSSFFESNKTKVLAAMILGAVCGLALSFMVNSALIEISLNAFFAFYFGIIFLIVGCILIYRVRTQEKFKNRTGLLFFGVLVVISGICCFVFNRHWLFDLPSLSRVPLYSLIGMSFSFAIVFSTIDLINFCGRRCFPNGPAIIESETQVRFVLSLSIMMGIGYGFLFGFLEVGKNVDNSSNPAALLALQERHEQLFSIPFGLLSGAFGAAINEILRYRQARESEYKYSPLFQEDDYSI